MKRRCSELEFPSFNSPPLKGGVKLKLLGNSYSVIHDENHKIIILIINLQGNAQLQLLINCKLVVIDVGFARDIPIELSVKFDRFGRL